MKKHLTLLLLAVFSIAAFVIFPTENSFKASLLYTSTVNSSDTVKTTPKVKITPKKKVSKKTTKVTETKKTEATKTEITKKTETTAKETKTGTATATTEADVCGFDGPADQEPVYSAQIITIRKKFRYSENEEFQVKVYVKNTGNMPWFSPDSKCVGARVYLGTTREVDRASAFYNKDLTGWTAANRIRLEASQMRVDPGEAALFVFEGKAGTEPSVYREFFAPVVEGVGWLADAEFKVDVYTGTTNESAEELRKKLLYAFKSMRVNDMQVDGKRKIEIDLSEQMLYLKIDDYVVREFRVSTGKSSTPTPTGNFKVLLKNEVRIGHEAPHYIMPKYQMFTSMGAGLHALPSLGNDGGVFWTEARNHIGIPVSHGCVRMLPEDADFAFEFTEVGDPVEIHW